MERQFKLKFMNIVYCVGILGALSQVSLGMEDERWKTKSPMNSAQTSTSSYSRSNTATPPTEEGVSLGSSVMSVNSSACEWLGCEEASRKTDSSVITVTVESAVRTKKQETLLAYEVYMKEREDQEQREEEQRRELEARILADNKERDACKILAARDEEGSIWLVRQSAEFGYSVRSEKVGGVTINHFVVKELNVNN